MPDQKEKPRLDEQTFGRLLEAAYVLQEHNRELHKLERNLELRNAQLGSPELLGQGTDRQAIAPQNAVAQEHSSEPTRHRSLSQKRRLALDSLPPQAEFDQPVGAATPIGSGSPTSVNADYTATLAQIVGTQHQIRARHLELENSMSLVAQRVIEIAKAGGAAIGFLDEARQRVRYRGVAGRMTLPAGTEVAVDKALCAASLRTGQIIRCPDVNPEFLFDPEECRRRGIQAMIVVPIFHEGGIAGGLELYYASTQAFTEDDVHTCQLMAGLITEALAREDELGWKKSLANERAVMLEALERLKPNLAALAETPSVKAAGARGAAIRNPASANISTPPTFICRKCGHKLLGQEQFCGKCGLRRGNDPDSSRRSNYEAPSMQSKLASLWEVQDDVQEAIRKTVVDSPVNGDLSLVSPPLSDPALPEKPLADSIEEEMPELFAAPERRAAAGREKMPEPEHLPESASLELKGGADNLDLTIPQVAEPLVDSSLEVEKEIPGETALLKPVPATNWNSALSARQFLEQLAGTEHPGALARFWRARRGDIYLAIAVILVAAVIRWGIWSNHSVGATVKPTPTAAAGHRNAAPDADLSLFDRMLISLGLADPPAAPEYKGNPDTQVWVDLHTALYYCPGSDLYGKTAKGKFATQRDAQLDQFEPAYRKACD